MFLTPGNHATIGDVAQSLRDFVPCRYGIPVAIDVMFDVSSELSRSSAVKPVGLKYKGDPAAEFDCTVPREAIFTAPNHVAQSNMTGRSTIMTGQAINRATAKVWLVGGGVASPRVLFKESCSRRSWRCTASACDG